MRCKMALELPYCGMPSGRNRQLLPSEQSFFLLGPRGTGKTYWVRSTFPEALYVSLLDPEVHRHLAARPEHLGELASAVPDDGTIVIDEIQKLPILLEVVHALISEGRRIRFVLTGSSARKLRRGNVNLLGGRALQVHMHPYIASELGDDFSLERALTCGLVPLVVESPTPEETLRAYASLYIQQEVFAEGLTRSDEQFARFLEAISLSHGEILTVTNVARDCAVKRKTVENYVETLEDLLLAYRVPVFAHHAKRDLVSHPKFYFFDAGMFRTLRPTGPLDDLSSIQGHALEGLVAQHLKAFCDYARDGRKLYYWRTRSGAEVDFIVYGPTTFDAIEVKNTSVVRPEHLRSLSEFVKLYPQANATLLYRGNERFVRGNVRVEPVDAWLKQLR